MQRDTGGVTPAPGDVSARLASSSLDASAIRTDGRTQERDNVTGSDASCGERAVGGADALGWREWQAVAAPSASTVHIPVVTARPEPPIWITSPRSR